MASKIREDKMMRPVFIYCDYRPDYIAVKVVIRHWYSDMEPPRSIYFMNLLCSYSGMQDWLCTCISMSRFFLLSVTLAGELEGPDRDFVSCDIMVSSNDNNQNLIFLI